MSGRRGYALTLLLLAAASVSTLLLTGLAWISATYALPGQTWTESVSLSGRDVAPIAAAAAWVGLASVVAVIATSGVTRRVVGGVVALAGAGVAIDAAVGMGGAAAAVTSVITRVGGTLTATSLLGVWPVLTVIAGLLILACGLSAAVRGAQWPTMSARYDRTPAQRPADPWSALDRGEDPTAS